jgi:hypothetical protein
VRKTNYLQEEGEGGEMEEEKGEEGEVERRV